MSPSLIHTSWSLAITQRVYPRYAQISPSGGATRIRCDQPDGERLSGVRPWLLAGGAAAALLAMVACGQPGRPAAAATPAGYASRGCATAPGGTQVLTPWLGGRQRLARVHLPARDPGRRALPLVLNLHGTGSTAAHQE